MKLGIFSLPDIPVGKRDVKDSRLDEVSKITGSKKRVYMQVELVGEDAVRDADAILAQADAKADLILQDLDFVDTRLSRTQEEKEKEFLGRLKGMLEKETLIATGTFSEDDKKYMAGYGLLTAKPVVFANASDLEDVPGLIARAVGEAGYIGFFTTGEKETRSWLIKKGTTAWEAAGAIHSDIQRGFIRAEIISLADFLSCGGETPAKQAGKQRLEQKEYIMQEGDLTNFRFNK